MSSYEMYSIRLTLEQSGLHNKRPVNGADRETHEYGTVSVQLSFTLFIDITFIMKMNSFKICVFRKKYRMQRWAEIEKGLKSLIA